MGQVSKWTPWRWGLAVVVLVGVVIAAGWPAYQWHRYHSQVAQTLEIIKHAKIVALSDDPDARDFHHAQDQLDRLVTRPIESIKGTSSDDGKDGQLIITLEDGALPEIKGHCQFTYTAKQQVWVCQATDPCGQSAAVDKLCPRQS